MSKSPNKSKSVGVDLEAYRKKVLAEKAKDPVGFAKRNSKAPRVQNTK